MPPRPANQQRPRTRGGLQRGAAPAHIPAEVPEPAQQRVARRDTSKYPVEEREARFTAKFGDAWITEKSVTASLAQFGLTERFQNLGWENVLELGTDDGERRSYYKHVLLAWMRTLTRNQNGSLVGRINGNEVMVTAPMIRNTVRIDTLENIDYNACPWKLSKSSYGADYAEMVSRITGKSLQWAQQAAKVSKSDLLPMDRVINRVVSVNVLPRTSDLVRIRDRDVIVIHAIMFGRPSLSWAHIFLQEVWESYDSWRREYIPFCLTLSRLFIEMGMVAVVPRYRGERLVREADEESKCLSSAIWIEESHFADEYRFRIRNYRYVIRNKTNTKTLLTVGRMPGHEDATSSEESGEEGSEEEEEEEGNEPSNEPRPRSRARFASPDEAGPSFTAASPSPSQGVDMTALSEMIGQRFDSLEASQNANFRGLEANFNTRMTGLEARVDALTAEVRAGHSTTIGSVRTLARRAEELEYVDEDRWTHLSGQFSALSLSLQNDRDTLMGGPQANVYPTFHPPAHMSYFPEYFPDPVDPECRFDYIPWYNYFGPNPPQP